MLTPLILALLFNTLISPPPNPYIAPFSRTGPSISFPNPYTAPFSRTGPSISIPNPYTAPFSRTGSSISVSVSRLP